MAVSKRILSIMYKQIEVLDVVKPGDVDEALENKEIAAIIDENHNLKINENGTEQTVVKMIADQVVQIASLGPDAVKIQRNVYVDYLQQKSDPLLLSYYSLIGMTAAFGYFSGIYTSDANQANLSDVGRRKNIVPIKKSTMLLGGFLSSLLINLLSLMILFVMMEFVYKLNLFTDPSKTFFMAFIGSLFGTALGIFIGSFKGDINKKTMLGIGLSLFLSFLAGMMTPEPVYAIKDSMPWLERWNPVSIITVNLIRINQLNFYGDYWSGIGRLLVVTAGLLIGSYFLLRRKSYDSL